MGQSIGLPRGAEESTHTQYVAAKPCVVRHQDGVSSVLYRLSVWLQLVPFPPGVKLEQLTHHADGRHFLALSQNREVFSWGTGDHGRLGLGETR